MKLRAQIAVALTLAAGLFFLGYYTTYLMWEDLRPWRTYRATFARTIGLAKEDPVFVLGYHIGRVHQISLEGDHQLVELQVEPAVRLHAEGLRVVIEPTDSFGNVGIYVDPGQPQSGNWDPDVPISGAFRESLAAGSGGGGEPGALSQSLKDFEALTRTFTQAEQGVGRWINDPDAGFALKERFASARATTGNMREALLNAATGDGFGQLLVPDNAVTFDEALAGTHGNLEDYDAALRAANHGEAGLLARLAGDRDFEARLRESLGLGASLFRGYQHGEGTGVAAALNHDEAPADRLGAIFDELARETGEARRGEGILGGAFGPSSGVTMRESLAGFEHRLESMSTADPSEGTFFSPAIEGRRAADDVAARIDDVLRDMRRALGRIRQDQAPNTFPGALLSVF